MGHRTPLKLISSTQMPFLFEEEKARVFPLKLAFCAPSKAPDLTSFLKRKNGHLELYMKAHLIDSLISANKNILVERILKRQWKGSHSHLNESSGR